MMKYIVFYEHRNTKETKWPTEQVSQAFCVPENQPMHEAATGYRVRHNHALVEDSKNGICHQAGQGKPRNAASVEDQVTMIRTLNLPDVIRLLRQGLPYTVIAERLGCHANTIGYHAKKLGYAGRRAKR
jgi:hypothetical protein